MDHEPTKVFGSGDMSRWASIEAWKKEVDVILQTVLATSSKQSLALEELKKMFEKFSTSSKEVEEVSPSKPKILLGNARRGIEEEPAATWGIQKREEEIRIVPFVDIGVQGSQRSKRGLGGALKPVVKNKKATKADEVENLISSDSETTGKEKTHPISKSKAPSILKGKAAPIPKEKAPSIPKEKAPPIPKEKAPPSTKEKGVPLVKDKGSSILRAQGMPDMKETGAQAIREKNVPGSPKKEEDFVGGEATKPKVPTTKELKLGK